MRLKSFEGPWKSFLLRMARSGQCTLHSALRLNQLFFFTFHATNLNSTAHNCFEITSVRMLLPILFVLPTILLVLLLLTFFSSAIDLLVGEYMQVGTTWGSYKRGTQSWRHSRGAALVLLALACLRTAGERRTFWFSSPATYTQHSSMLSNNYLEQAHPLPYLHNKSSLIRPLFMFADVDLVHPLTCCRIHICFQGIDFTLSCKKTW